MDTDQQLEILRQAAAGALPASIGSDSSIPVLIIKDLVHSGHIVAKDTSSLDGPSFRDARITSSGREHLRVLDERTRAASIPGKASKHFSVILKWFFGIVAALLVAYLAERFIA